MNKQKKIALLLAIGLGAGVAAVVDTHERLAVSLANLGGQAFNNHNLTRAKKYYELALLIDRHSIQIRTQYADTLFQLDKPIRALEEFSAVLKEDPSDGWARLYRGRAYNKLHRYAEATADFKIALRWFIKVDGNAEMMFDTQRDLAHSLEKEGQFKESEKLFGELLTTLGEAASGEDYRNRAVLRLKLSRFKAALEDVEMAESRGEVETNDLTDLKFLALEGLSTQKKGRKN